MDKEELEEEKETEDDDKYDFNVSPKTWIHTILFLAWAIAGQKYGYTNAPMIIALILLIIT